MSTLSALHGELTAALGDSFVLQETSLHQKGCGCAILNLSVEGMKRDDFPAVRRPLLETVSRFMEYDLPYLGFFPGTKRVTRVGFRRFCARCRDNYRLERKIGLFTEEIET